MYGAELGRAGLRGGVGQGVRHRAGQGDAAQFGGASDGFLPERVPAAGRRVVAGEQPLIEVDGGEVAEAGHGDVEEFAGGGLQVQGVADPGATSLSSARLRRALAASRAAMCLRVTSVASPATPMGRPDPLCTR